LQVFLPELALYSQSLETELRLYRLTGGKVVTRAKDLPKGAVDIIITALEDQARYCTLYISVGDPDAEVFWPLGSESGSISQRYGSGSGSFPFLKKVLSGLKIGTGSA
jgi:hypothetical protein